MTAEVTPHHLALTDEDVARVGLLDRLQDEPAAPLAPPTSRPCREGLADGTLDAIATDHAPHSRGREGRRVRRGRERHRRARDRVPGLPRPRRGAGVALGAAPRRGAHDRAGARVRAARRDARARRARRTSRCSIPARSGRCRPRAAVLEEPEHAVEGQAPHRALCHDHRGRTDRPRGGRRTER